MLFRVLHVSFIMKVYIWNISVRFFLLHDFSAPKPATLHTLQMFLTSCVSGYNKAPLVLSILLDEKLQPFDILVELLQLLALTAQMF